MHIHCFAQYWCSVYLMIFRLPTLLTVLTILCLLSKEKKNRKINVNFLNMISTLIQTCIETVNRYCHRVISKKTNKQTKTAILHRQYSDNQKLSFGEVNRLFYGRKFRFIVTHEWSHKTQFTTITLTIISPNDNFQYCYAHSKALFHIFPFKTVYCLLKSSGVSDI